MKHAAVGMEAAAATAGFLGPRRSLLAQVLRAGVGVLLCGWGPRGLHDGGLEPGLTGRSSSEKGAPSGCLRFQRIGTMTRGIREGRHR